MKKIIALFAPIFFFLASSAQRGTYSKETFDSIIVVSPSDTATTITVYEVPNGFAGSSWLHIVGDTAKWCVQSFDWRDNSKIRACSIHPLICNTEYDVELVTKCKNQPAKTARKHFTTTKCVSPPNSSLVKKSSWFHRLFFGN